jgi:hypothetical protein
MQYNSWYECIRGCGRRYSIYEVVYKCEDCGGLLDVEHDLDALKKKKTMPGNPYSNPVPIHIIGRMEAVYGERKNGFVHKFPKKMWFQPMKDIRIYSSENLGGKNRCARLVGKTLR